MANDKIVIKGAREHNLKNVSLTLPREKFIVMTGLSGSGKSSLAFDTIYADGQRRYVESLSSYARMFLGRMDKPDVDEITGLSPAISIDQKTTSHNPRSTVGTVTEIYDYLRLLYARIGVPHCPVCGRVISQQTVDEMVDAVLKLEEGARFQVLAPVVRQRKGTQQKELDAARRAGYTRVKVDGSLYDLDEEITLEKNIKHTVEVVVDRLVIREGVRSRLADSLETALSLTGGVAEVEVIGGQTMTFSQNFACPEHGVSVSELTPRLFSFNNPQGACEKCTGLGIFMKVDEDRIIPNRSLSIRQGAIKASGWYYAEGSVSEMYYIALGKRYGFTLDTPLRDFSTEARNALLYGTNGEKLELHRTNEFGSGKYYGEFEGIVENLERRFRETGSEWVKEEIAGVMSGVKCPACKGRRLKPVVLAVTVGGVNISQFCEMSIREELAFIRASEEGGGAEPLTSKQRQIGGQILKEIRTRLEFLQSVGLDYLTLARSAGTLSGGESQRIRLTTQIGSALSGVLYVLDEPSIGLHPANIVGLTGVMQDLVADGNSVLLVDHDTQILRQADWLVEMGPGAGAGGGQVIAEGTVEDIQQNPRSQIGPFLAGRADVRRKPVPPDALFEKGAVALSTGPIHTVRPLEVRLPKGRLTVVTGVSGSGKTTMVLESLVPAVQAMAAGAPLPGHVRALDAPGIAQIKLIDASPIGINVRSTVATYAGVHDELRKLYARTPDARQRGCKAGDFSYNTGRLRCPVCDGTGSISLDVQFLPDVDIPCPDCRGSRYSRDAGRVRVKTRSGAAFTLPELMAMDIHTALGACEDWKIVRQRLQVLNDLGLGYLTLGEATPSLSGGEAQRLKLASEMGRGQEDTVFVFDEPTIGLHPLDVRTLLGVFQTLMDSGATVVVIEHDLDVIHSADYLIDMGPGGGDEGGRIVACGTPEEVAGNPASVTGRFLG